MSFCTVQTFTGACYEVGGPARRRAAITWMHADSPDDAMLRVIDPRPLAAPST
jgi:hypothetical protein